MSIRSLTALIASFAFVVIVADVPKAFAQQAQPRDPRSDVPRPASARELALQSAVAGDPNNVANWLELATLQEARGAILEAEDALKTALLRSGNDSKVLNSLARFYGRTGQFDKAVATLQDAAAQNPNDPAGHHLVATYFWEKAQKDPSLSPEDKLRYIDAGISASDRALAINGDYIEALTYKNILLRMKANLGQDPAARQALLAEADTLRSRAMELQKTKRGVTVQEEMSMLPGPPPPPPPGAPGAVAADPAAYPPGQAPVRVGGNIKVPTKIKNVAPVYPAEAQANGITGLVVLETVIDTDGNVYSARVLRSVPLLDEAAMEAVKQWKFTPTLLDGVPVPVMMTVTVNFTLR